MSDEKKADDPVMPSPTEVIETLDTITAEAQTLRKKITVAVAKSTRSGRLAATNDPTPQKRKRRKRKKAR